MYRHAATPAFLRTLAARAEGQLDVLLERLLSFAPLLAPSLLVFPTRIGTLMKFPFAPRSTVSASTVLKSNFGPQVPIADAEVVGAEASNTAEAGFDRMHGKDFVMSSRGTAPQPSLSEKFDQLASAVAVEFAEFAVCLAEIDAVPDWGMKPCTMGS